MYEHESTSSSGVMNTSWPEMSTSGKVIDRMKEYLMKRDLSFELAEENGWYMSYEAGDSNLRLVIPAVTREAGHVYWQARAVDPDVRIRYQSPSGPRLDALVVVKPVESSQRTAVVVEGPMDALAAAGLGFYSIALMGMTPSGSTVDFLKQKLLGRPTLILLDNELEAFGNAVRLSLELSSRGIRAKAVGLSQGKDLASLIFYERLLEFKRFLAKMPETTHENKKGRQQQVRNGGGKAIKRKSV